MPEFVQFNLDEGGTVLVVADQSDQGVGRASRAGDVVNATASSFGAALSSVRRAAYEAMREFRDTVDSPDEVEIEFGVQLNAEAGAVISKAGVEGHLTIKIMWRRAEAATQ